MQCCLLAGVIAVMSPTAAVGEVACRPILAFTAVEYSPMQLPALERKWTAVISVNASRCAPHSQGQFDIVFSRLKEIGPELEFREHFKWLSPSVTVQVGFWADEAVERYWIEKITPCPCAR